jgi:ankyrin repeat protein
MTRQYTFTNKAGLFLSCLLILLFIQSLILYAHASDADNNLLPEDMIEQAAAKNYSLRQLLLEGKFDEFKQLAVATPELKLRSATNLFTDLITYAAAANQLDLVQWLHEHCADCVLSHSGESVIDFMGRVYEGFAWQSMNAETFKYVFDNGGVDAFSKARPDNSVFVFIADYWIPEGEGGYSDYIVVEADAKFEQQRRQDKLDILTFLLQNGYDVNDHSKTSNITAIYNAAAGNDEQLVDFLMANGADPAVGRNALGGVSGYVTPELLKKLLEFGYNPNEVTPTHYASASTTLLGRVVSNREFKPELLEILEEYNVDFELKDSAGKTPIDYTIHEIEYENRRYTDYLVSKGATLTPTYHYAMLLFAIQRSKPEILHLVLDSHPHLANGLTNDQKYYPLEKAIFSSGLDTFKALLDAGATLHDEDFFATRLLNGAVRREKYDIATLILETHPEVPVNILYEQEGVEIAYSEAISEASSQGNLEWVEKLLEMGASLEAKRFFDLPIVGPALNGHTDVVKALLDAGSIANPNRKGESLVEMLIEDGKVEMAEILKNSQAQ